MQSYKHKDKRPLTPSIEEAGMEADNELVKGKTTAHYPKNPVTTRGQDPELFWLHKYGPTDTDDTLAADIRSLYRVEHISPELLLEKLYATREVKPAQLDLFSMFGNAMQLDEFEKVSEYYQHADDWKNRLIQGDSLLVMTSLLQREGMAGKVQTIYFDPPYGIKYGSNWQMRLNNRDVKDGADDALSGEPEQIKAFRDTWELGIHSYLSYMRDRLLVARELLHDSGSCFVQISDENVHLVRCLMDEVFGSENFVSLITVQKTTGAGSPSIGTFSIASVSDYILWYCKDINLLKYRQLYNTKSVGGEGSDAYTFIELPNQTRRRATNVELENAEELIKEGYRFFRLSDIRSQSGNEKFAFSIELQGNLYHPKHLFWKTNEQGIANLIKHNRLISSGNTLNYVRYIDDFPAFPINNLWGDLSSGVGDKVYVVQTNQKIIQRCLLMTTDPGDLVLDPTCGSGTTAYVAEQWGRRWITTDTSRIALNIAKTRLMTATFSYYYLHSDVKVERIEKNGKIQKKIIPKNPLSGGVSEGRGGSEGDLRQGFVYEEVPHITLKSLANDEPADTETLYDRPYTDKNRLRVAGPFTVETLQNFEPVSPETLENPYEEVKSSVDTQETFERLVFERLQSAGINNGDKGQHTRFNRVERLPSEYLHAEGFYTTEKGEQKAYIHLGGKFSTVSKEAVSRAIKDCRARGDADWLIVMGFSFEADIPVGSHTTSMGSFQVTKCRLHDDFLQEGLLKKPNKTSGSFVTIGEPDITLTPIKEGEYQVEILGLDIYDPIKDDVRARSRADIAYWMLDDDYDGSNFIVRQVFFCGGDKDEFAKWQKGLSDLAKQGTKKQAERTLKIEIDEEAFDRLYGFISHPIPYRKGRRVAVRVISQFGEESTKVLSMK